MNYCIQINVKKYQNIINKYVYKKKWGSRFRSSIYMHKAYEEEIKIWNKTWKMIFKIFKSQLKIKHRREEQYDKNQTEKNYLINKYTNK